MRPFMPPPDGESLIFMMLPPADDGAPPFSYLFRAPFRRDALRE